MSDELLSLLTVHRLPCADGGPLLPHICRYRYLPKRRQNHRPKRTGTCHHFCPLWFVIRPELLDSIEGNGGEPGGKGRRSWPTKVDRRCNKANWKVATPTYQPCPTRSHDRSHFRHAPPFQSLKSPVSSPPIIQTLSSTRRRKTVSHGKVQVERHQEPIDTTLFSSLPRPSIPG